MAKVMTALARFTLKSVSTALPKRMKRLVLWSSLYACLRQSNNLAKEDAIELNNTMDLGTHADALKAPAGASFLIWPELTACVNALEQALTNELCRTQAAIEFAHRLPQCLRYSNDQDICSDFNRMLSCKVVSK